MRIWLLFFSFFSCFNLYAQNTIRGRVTDEETGKPLSGANVFISNTQKGTASDPNGEFVIAYIPDGKYDLIISLVGYETVVYSFSSEKLPLKLDVKMTIKRIEQEMAIVRPFEKDGWVKWGKLFTESFIGTSDHAWGCEIVNKDVIRFRFDKKNNILEAVANDMIIIKNPDLGYTIKYQLEGFVYNQSTRVISYVGYPLFEKTRNNRKQKKNRLKAYRGSITHFMRSLYSNRLAEEGFEVRRLVQVRNTEKDRVRPLARAAMQNRINSGGNRIVIGAETPTQPGDSMTYYNRIMRQPDSYDVLYNYLLTADSLVVFSGDSLYKGFSFQNHLQIVYKNEEVSPEYKSQHMFSGPMQAQTTKVNLIGDAVRILFGPQGDYFSPLDLFMNGYMAWEKVAELLPFDYEPDE
jgi:hypothetical protein